MHATKQVYLARLSRLLSNLPFELISPLFLLERQQDLCNVLGTVSTKAAGLSAFVFAIQNKDRYRLTATYMTIS
jgi:hypothetical protein